MVLAAREPGGQIAEELVAEVLQVLAPEALPRDPRARAGVKYRPRPPSA